MQHRVHVAGVVEGRRAIDQVRRHVPGAQKRRQREPPDSRVDNQNAHVILFVLETGRKDQLRRAKPPIADRRPVELGRLPPSVYARRRRRSSIIAEPYTAPRMTQGFVVQALKSASDTLGSFLTKATIVQIS